METFDISRLSLHTNENESGNGNSSGSGSGSALFCEWKPLTKHRQCFGICYNNIYQRCFIAGGQVYDNSTDDMQNVRYCDFYDLTKDAWFSLPDTLYEHGFKPLMWIDYGYSPHVIHLMGKTRRKLLGFEECYDIRDSRRKWMDVTPERRFKDLIEDNSASGGSNSNSTNSNPISRISWLKPFIR